MVNNLPPYSTPEPELERVLRLIREPAPLTPLQRMEREYRDRMRRNDAWARDVMLFAERFSRALSPAKRTPPTPDQPKRFSPEFAAVLRKRAGNYQCLSYEARRELDNHANVEMNTNAMEATYTPGWIFNTPQLFKD